MHVLEPTFFASASMDVAPRLLNKVLVCGELVGRILEVEAYAGTNDPGSHGWRGKTPRTEPMFGPPGHWYVYLSYGVHWCINAVTNPDGDCGAVLIRAVSPVAGVEVMAQRRGRASEDPQLLNGPGKLTQAFGIDQRFNATAISLTGLASGGAGLASGGAGLASGGAGLASGGAGLASGGAGLASGGAGLASGGAGLASGGAGLASGGAGLAIADDGIAPPAEPLITPRIGLSPNRGADILARFVVPPK